MLARRQVRLWEKCLVEKRERCLRACWLFNNSFWEQNLPRSRAAPLFQKIIQPEHPATSTSFAKGEIGTNVTVAPPFNCDYGYNISIGNNVQIDRDCSIDDAGCVIIGNNCILGPGLTISTTLPTDHGDRRGVPRVATVQGVKIEDDCWIGGQVVICAGVCVGTGSTILPGAVVTEDVPPRQTIAGNPARNVQGRDQQICGVPSSFGLR
ncbi:putative nodulation protein L [Plectosphaerella cucumerina]|uniref:Nodulation protein L n=2 Tax=Plectosphaerella cucumerina TaxID=40658 RepID=A0A8K0T6K5_9PEZI|nr:putative nodulation protein L [Plectosphaerella cucumerina]